jgi:hypothetical protein
VRPLAVALVTVLAGAPPVAADPPARAAANYVSGQLIVGFGQQVSADRQRSVLRELGAKLRQRFAHIRGALVEPRSGLALSLLRRRLDRHPDVAYVERDYFLQHARAPDDPMFAQQYALASSGAGSTLAQGAWNTRTNCSKVAVLDTGVQYDHPDLKDNVWHNPDEKKNNGKDDDKNGYVDDYYGVNLVKGKGSGVDDEGHGTHVAGIIAARGNNGLGVSGLCWSAKVMAVKFMDSRGRGSTSDAVAGIDYAVREGAKIINGSFGSSSKSKSLEDEVEYAQDKGVLLVFAAGNSSESIDSDPSYPASFTNSNIVSVAAITATNALASFSNFGAKGVDLGAPGDSILSTYPTSTYKVLSGTSMATPYVAAAAAILRQQDPDLTYGKLRSAIRDHVTANQALAGKTVTGGQLDAAAALASVD